MLSTVPYSQIMHYQYLECFLFFREFYYRDFNISRINDNFKGDEK